MLRYMTITCRKTYAAATPAPNIKSSAASAFTDDQHAIQHDEEQVEQHVYDNNTCFLPDTVSSRLVLHVEIYDDNVS